MGSERNIYKEDINFAELASQDTDFAKVLKPNGQLDFSDPDSVQQLTKSLLKRDFNLSLTLPPDRLCPPVPNRLNYILWIQDLLDTSSESFSDRYDPKREVTGLDIGTGASCIYPLLGCAQRPKWRFIGTDIDDLSLNYAQQNITLNKVDLRIKLLNSTLESPLIPLDFLGIENVDFTLCNPPFYASTTELLFSASQKSRPPNSACTGSATEMVTPGGEIAFVSRMINESLKLRTRVQWYSSMLGKLSSVSMVIEQLRKAGISNCAVTEFVQGSKTRRWAVAWSFGDLRPRMAVARGVVGGGLPKAFLPFPSEYVVQISKGVEVSVEGVKAKLNATLSSLPLRWMWRPEIGTGVGFSPKNVWSRSARRRFSQHPDEQEEAEREDEDEVAFGFKTIVEDVQTSIEVGKGVQIIVRWLKGTDSALFESFCGMVKRKVEA